MTVYHWHALTTADFAKLDLDRAVAVMPTGAVEQHGPHLPLGTDLLVVRALVARAVSLVPNEIPVLLLPDTAVGYSAEHQAFPGTLSLPHDVLTAAWVATGTSIVHAGVKRLLIANAHGGQVPVMDIAARELRAAHGMMVLALSWPDFGLPEGVAEVDEALHDIHGGGLETSMMLHLHPELVRTDKAVDFVSATRDLARDHPTAWARGAAGFGWLAQDLNPAGAVGDATIADAEIGRRLVDHAAEGFARAIEDLADMTVPLGT